VRRPTPAGAAVRAVSPNGRPGDRAAADGRAGAGGAGRVVPHADRGVPRLAEVEADLRARLRPACRDWAEADFDALVVRIARVKVRWAEAEYPD
jgi:hypothetical protein